MKTMKNKVGIVITSILAIFLMYFTFGVEEVSANGVYDYSMYFRSSEVATAFGKGMAPKLSDGNDDSDAEFTWLGGELTPGNAGGLLGYTRGLSESEGGVEGWISSRLSGNTMTYGYDQLVELGGSGSVEGNPLLAYGGYGGLLESTNLATSRDFNFMDTFNGFLFQGLFILSQAVPFFFNLVLKLLVLLNPFQMFSGAIEGIAGIGESLPIFGTLIEFVSDIYLSIQDISLYVILPVIVGMTAMSIFYKNREGAGKKMFRLFFRFFMVFAGLPLIGATYTGVITNLADNMTLGSPFANYVIASQFVDTEGWMKATRLAPPTENPLEYNYSDGEFSYNVFVSRETVMEINTNRVKGNLGLSGLRGMSATDSLESDQNEGNYSVRQTSIGQDLLDRYRRKDRFSASDYEGFVKSQIDSKTDAQIESMFKPDASELIKMDGGENDYSSLFEYAPTPEAFGDELNWSIYNMGGLIAVNESGSASHFSSYGTSSDDGNVLTAASTDTNSDWNDAAGLSPLAMYNFLNTRFGTTNMVVYSPETSASVFTSNDYMSVSRVNSGVFGGVSIVESIVLLTASAFIGATYAWALLGIAIASIPRIMTSAIGTASGSMAMITKLLISTIVLIAEIVGTILIFVVFDTLLLNILRSMTIFVENISSMGLGGLLIGSFALVIKQLLVIVLGIAVTRFALKYRVRFSKMVEETSVDMITKLMGGLDNSLNQGEMFHDPSAVAGAGAKTKLHGNDGLLGTDGSTSYAGEVAGGEHAEDKKGMGIRDAFGEEFSQQRSKARIQGEDYKAPSKGELLSSVVSRKRDRAVAGAKDKVADKLGMGGLIIAAMGGPDLDGQSRQRMFEEEEAERQQLSDEYRGFGRNAPDDKGVSGDTGIKGVSGDTGIKDGVGGPGGGADGVITDSEGIESYENMISSIDGQDPDGILNEHIGMDDEELAMLDDDGEIYGNQAEYGSVADAVEETRSDSPTYDMDDQNADDLMVGAFGDESDGVSLDDPTDHPESLTPLSDEHDQYVEDLGVAADAQTESALRHSEAVATEEAEAERLLSQAEALESKLDMTDEDKESAGELRAQSAKHTEKAMEHQKQGRQSLRKADKLMAKQKDANKLRIDGQKDHGKNQSKSVNASRNMTKAEAKVEQMADKLNDLKASGANDTQIAKAEQELNQSENELKSLKQEARSAMPSYKSDSLMASSKEELQDMAKNQNWSSSKLATRMAYLPDEAQAEQGQDQAAQVLGQMANLTGSSPRSTMKKQEAFMNRELGQLRDQIDPNLPKETARTQQKVGHARKALQTNMSEMRSLTPGATKKERDTVQAKVNSSRAALSSAESDFENVSAMNNANTVARVQLRSLEGAFKSNKEHLSGQSRSIDRIGKSARQINSRNNNYANAYRSAKGKLQPNNSAIIMSNKNNPSYVNKMNEVLESENIRSPEAFKNRIESTYSDVDRTLQEKERLETRIKSSSRSTDTFKRGRLQAEMRDINTKLNAQKQVGRGQRRKLLKNAPGLYRDSGFRISTSDNMRITEGKPINAPIPDVINSAEHLGRLSAKLENTIPMKDHDLTDELRARRDQINNEYNVVRTQLINAGISENMLRTRHSISEVVKGLNQEWMNTIGYDPADKRN